MSDERTTTNLTAEEIAETVRRRKARSRYGALFAIGGFVLAILAMWVFESLAFATLWLAVSMMGAGFTDPGEIKGLWGR